MPVDRRCWFAPLVSLILSVLAAVPAAAGSGDEAIRDAFANGKSARVIMQFASSVERDAAFQRLLDRGAAVRLADTEAGPALVAFGTAAAFSGELSRASQVSLDAGVSVSAVKQPPRGTWRPTPRASPRPAVDPRRTALAVAIIDSGVQPHPDLPASRIRVFKDFVDGSAAPIDGCGHGTHVAGVVAGNGRHSNGSYAGIAPTVDIVALRVLGDDCSGNTSDVIDALEWIGRNHAAYRIKVVNLSLGHAVLESIFTDPLVQAVERLSRKGVAVVTAAGNRGLNAATDLPGYGGAGVPCNAPSSICVGALDTSGSDAFDDDRVSASSSRGPTRFDLLAKPDLVAPGVGIVSLAAPGSRLFTEFEALRVAGSSGAHEYFMLSGTSMASPAVAAAAALLLQANPALPVHALKLALQFTARLVPATDVLTQGAGALNISGALTLATAINPNARRGQNWMRYRITASNADANGQTIRWSQRIIYGDRFVRPRYAQIHLFRWDDDLAWAYDAIAGGIDWGRGPDNIVWGDDNIVWGNRDNIVWGNDDTIVWGNAEDRRIAWGTDEHEKAVWGIADPVAATSGNIVWGNRADDNIVWGNGVVRGSWASNVVSGFWDEAIVWGTVTRDNMDNIVWGNATRCEWGFVSCE